MVRSTSPRTCPGQLSISDGIYKGSTQSGTSFNIIAVSSGTHALSSVPGYSDYTQTVQVNPGQITYVNAVFTPAPATPLVPGTTTSPATGSVIATSAPSGAQVYLDNQFRGVTPVTIYNVAAGTHIVNMKLTGYADWSSSIDVLASQIAQV